MSALPWPLPYTRPQRRLWLAMAMTAIIVMTAATGMRRGLAALPIVCDGADSADVDA